MKERATGRYSRDIGLSLPTRTGATPKKFLQEYGRRFASLGGSVASVRDQAEASTCERVG